MARQLIASQDYAETYKAFVYEYEKAKAESRWSDSQDAAASAQQVAIHLTPAMATELREEVLSGRYAPPKPQVDRSRYEIVKDEVEYDCEHPLCGQLHKNFPAVRQTLDEVKRWENSWMVDQKYKEDPNRYHPVKFTQWLIIDNQTGERAFDGDMYRTRREAQDALAWKLS